MARHRTILVAALLIAGCGPPRPPAGPGGAPDLPEGLAGRWESPDFGVTLVLSEEGSFEWVQGEVTRKGTFRVEGSSLVLVAEGRYSTAYSIVQLSPGRLVIADPKGTEVPFTGEQPAGAAGEAGPVDVQGVWSNTTFAVRIELAADSTFVWKQGDIVETGSYAVEPGAIHMTTGGRTSTYRIASLSGEEMILIDPAGNQLPLARLAGETPPVQPQPIGKDSLLAGAPPIKIVDLGKGSLGPRLEPVLSKHVPPASRLDADDGIFYFQPPAGWKADEQKVCGNKFKAGGMEYACWKRNDLHGPDSDRIHFEMASFLTWAAPGALEQVSPQIDAMLAGYAQDRTSVSDEISEMHGFEVFSTRLEGRASASGKQLRGRIVGIHYGDMLLVGVLALSADPGVVARWSSEVEAMLDSMDFHFAANPTLESAVQGTWKGGGGEASFWSDSTYSWGSGAGSWMVVGSTLVMAADPLGEGPVVALPVEVEGDSLRVGGELLER